jgi:cytochrome b involved in lipid metabolism
MALDAQFVSENILLIMGSAVVCAVIIFFVFSGGGAGAAQREQGKSAKAADKPAAPLPKLTKSEVAKHNANNDCWIIVEGKVYDISQFIEGEEHPGGNGSFNNLMGKDVTKEFRGTQHFPDSVDGVIAKYFIGNLVDESNESSGGDKK